MSRYKSHAVFWHFSPGEPYSISSSSNKRVYLKYLRITEQIVVIFPPKILNFELKKKKKWILPYAPVCGLKSRSPSGNFWAVGLRCDLSWKKLSSRLQTEPWTPVIRPHREAVSASLLLPFYCRIRCEIRCWMFHVICSEIKLFDLQAQQCPLLLVRS